MTLEGRTLTVECPCAGTPHERDTVTFKAVLPLAGGVAGISAMVRAAQDLGSALDNIGLAGYVFPVYLAHAIEAWTFVNSAGEPVPLADGDKVLPFGVKYEIADAADDLFGAEISVPLAKMIAQSSDAGPTARRTSRKRSSGASPRSPSARSSQTVSAATEQ